MNLSFREVGLECSLSNKRKIPVQCRSLDATCTQLSMIIMPRRPLSHYRKRRRGTKCYLLMFRSLIKLCFPIEFGRVQLTLVCEKIRKSLARESKVYSSATSSSLLGGIWLESTKIKHFPFPVVY